MRTLILIIFSVFLVSFRTEAVLAQEQPVELHFKDTYAGEEVIVSLNGEEVETFVAKTRFQIGLAHVVHIKAETGTVIGISIPQLDLAETITLETLPRYVIIRLQKGDLIIEQTDQPQMYM